MFCIRNIVGVVSSFHENHLGLKNLGEEAVIYHTYRNGICMRKKCKNERAALRKELDSYANAGIDLWIDGSPNTPRKIEKALRVAEEGTYMRDYVLDADGRLVRVAFDAVKQE